MTQRGRHVRSHHVPSWPGLVWLPSSTVQHQQARLCEQRSPSVHRESLAEACCYHVPCIHSSYYSYSPDKTCDIRLTLCPLTGMDTLERRAVRSVASRRVMRTPGACSGVIIDPRLRSAPGREGMKRSCQGQGSHTSLGRLRSSKYVVNACVFIITMLHPLLVIVVPPKVVQKPSITRRSVARNSTGGKRRDARAKHDKKRMARKR